MKEITVKAYEFDELSDAAKEKAREWFRSASCGDDFWSECVIDEAVEQGGHLGIDFKMRERKNAKGESLLEKPCIWYSGFWSQGDGACFEGTWRAGDVKADKVAEGWGPDPATTEIKRIAAEFDRIAKLYPCSSFSVEHRGHYQHENCTEFDFFITEDEAVGEDEQQQAEEVLKENAKDFMRWIYRQLEKACEWQNADEQVDENIRSNEYMFTESGSRSTVL